MRKYIIFLLVVVVTALGVLYVRLFARQAEYRETLAAATDSVLVLRNFNQGKVRIVTADTDRISIDFSGSADDILKMLEEENGALAAVDFGGAGAGVNGTITVPRGTLLDVSLSGDGVLEVSDGTGQRTYRGTDSFLVDTANLNSFGVGDSGELNLDGWGSLIVWDDNQWDLLDKEAEGSQNGASENGTQAAYCGVGSQAIRNYCCVLQNKDTEEPACAGTGRWLFDNSDRQCAFECLLNEDDENETEPAETVRDCSVGSQPIRNNCCALNNAGRYQGCIGFWTYNNASQDCVFTCSNGLPEEEGGDEGGSGPSYGDPVSDYCMTIQEPDDRDNCCNDALKNNLSSGPHPGYPDCIGTWYFDLESGCEFKCAEHTEMMEILQELKERANQN